MDCGVGNIDGIHTDIMQNIKASPIHICFVCVLIHKIVGEKRWNYRNHKKSLQWTEEVPLGGGTHTIALVNSLFYFAVKQ